MIFRCDRNRASFLLQTADPTGSDTYKIHITGPNGKQLLFFFDNVTVMIPPSGSSHKTNFYPIQGVFLLAAFFSDRSTRWETDFPEKSSYIVGAD